MDRNEVFYDWQRAQLFEVGDDKDRGDWLLAAAKELAATLENKPHEVRCYTLVALDADIASDNSRVAATYELVKKHWANVEGRYQDTPTTILRGVMLSALYELGVKSHVLCRIIYYTASGYAQFVQFGREQPTIDRILREFGRDVEDEAREQWALAKVPGAPAFAPFKLKDFKLGSASVNANALKTVLTKAAGPDPTNNYGSYQQNTTIWPNHFGDVASSGVAKAIEGAITSFGESLSTTVLEAEINKYFKGVSDSLTKAFAVSFQSLQAVEQRSTLLWWKETLYSTTLGKGYRELDRAVLPVVMALDLFELLPDVTPVSVDYLLKDTYRAILGAEDEEQPLEKLVGAFEEEAHRKLLLPHLKEMQGCGERTTLTAFMAQVVHEKRLAKKLTASTGLRTTELATGAELAVLVLHDLVTERIVKQ
jgi:hypothetical protein